MSPHCNATMKQINGDALISKEFLEIKVQFSGLPGQLIVDFPDEPKCRCCPSIAPFFQ